MDASSLVFAGSKISPINGAISGLVTQIKTYAVDSGIPSGPNARAPLPIWKFGGRGIGVPSWDGQGDVVQNVDEGQAPAFLIKDARDEYSIETTWFQRSQVTVYLSIFCYLYVLPSLEGVTPDVQLIKRNMTNETLRAISHDVWPQESPYSVAAPQLVSVDYDFNISNLIPDIVIEPPWWVWKIDLALNVWNNI